MSVIVQPCGASPELIAMCTRRRNEVIFTSEANGSESGRDPRLLGTPSTERRRPPAVSALPSGVLSGVKKGTALR